MPGIGPVSAATIRAWFGDATQFPTAKHAAAFVGLNPSNWESGLMASPSRAMTKEGSPELRLAFYQAANVARRRDPALAVFYRRLMVGRHHNHIKATCAVARKLTGRVWATLVSGRPYELRDGVALYGLRHQAATTMIDARVDPKTVSERLGNSVATVLGTYTRARSSADRSAADLMGSLLDE